MAIKKGLGKGLEALLGEYSAESGDKVSQIDIKLIDINPDQPRKEFDGERLEELKESILRHGVVQPIILRKKGERYIIVAGERRYRASRLAKLKTVPAIIRDFDEKQVMEVALIENIQREDLNPLEVASAIDFLIKQHDLTHDEVAKRLGKARTTVTNSLRLLALPEKVKQALREGRLQAGQAKPLAGLDDESLQLKLAEEAAEQGWSSREVERRIAAIKEKKDTKPGEKKSSQSPDMVYAVGNLARRLGTKVQIKGNENKGSIVIDYYSKDDLNSIYELLMRE